MEIEKGLLKDLQWFKERSVDAYRKGWKNSFYERCYNDLLKYTLKKYVRKEGEYLERL